MKKVRCSSFRSPESERRAPKVVVFMSPSVEMNFFKKKSYYLGDVERGLAIATLYSG